MTDELGMSCEGCGTAMHAEAAEQAATQEDPLKWKCPRCESWCLTLDGDVLMAAWLVEGREWPH
jgi:hypothetical protein